MKGQKRSDGGSRVEELRQPSCFSLEYRELELKLNASGQRCDSSDGAEQSKQAVECCQETVLTLWTRTHAITD